jgi:hypothetical protein
MNDHLGERLSAYLDGELDSAAAGAVERHLAECADCRATLNQLGLVKQWAPGYTGVPATPELWGKVLKGIEQPVPIAKKAIAWHGRRINVGIPMLLAASVALLLIGAGLVYSLRPKAQQTASTDSTATPSDSTAVAGDTTPRAIHKWDWSLAANTEQKYDAAIAELENILNSSAGRLEPATLKVIRESLARIDSAIAQAKAAIARDSSGNKFLERSIEGYQKRKLALLRTAAQAASAQS